MTAATETPDVNRAIGERVHQIMWRNRITQTQLAARLGVVQPTLSKKLRGDRTWMPGELVAVAHELGVTVGELFGERTRPDPHGPGGAAPTGTIDDLCAIRDSNPEPADVTYLLVAA